jgi:hypothetical protein
MLKGNPSPSSRSGTDFVEFAADGRVSRVTMFYDSAPE